MPPTAFAPWVMAKVVGGQTKTGRIDVVRSSELLMEGPIRFDVWAQILGPRPRDAHLWLMERRPDSSEIQARRALVVEAHEGERLLLATAVGWAHAQQIVQTLPAWLGAPAVVQEGYSPSSAPGFCAEHRLSHGGCMGCQVCEGFYQP